MSIRERRSTSGGSSPLARGLPSRPTSPPDSHRIIPARAGFTRPGTAAYSPSADHPRSRGVYDVGADRENGPLGSSPLARGLPQIGIQSRPEIGIIPARAGFTGRRADTQNEPRDHPRSRGVYLGRDGARIIARGSSPLARGLLVAVCDVAGLARIIPARAGFTIGGGGFTSSAKDHPRSRGVYASALPWAWRSRGSSPLARGLPRNRR